MSSAPSPLAGAMYAGRHSAAALRLGTTADQVAHRPPAMVTEEIGRVGTAELKRREYKTLVNTSASRNCPQGKDDDAVGSTVGEPVQRRLSACSDRWTSRAPGHALRASAYDTWVLEQKERELEVDVVLTKVQREEARGRLFLAQVEHADLHILARAQFMGRVRIEAKENLEHAKEKREAEHLRSTFVTQEHERAATCENEVMQRVALTEREFSVRKDLLAAFHTQLLRLEVAKAKAEELRAAALLDLAVEVAELEDCVLKLKTRERPFFATATDFLPSGWDTVGKALPTPTSGPQCDMSAPTERTWAERHEELRLQELVLRRQLGIETDAFYTSLVVEEEELHERFSIMKWYLWAAHPLNLTALVTLQRWWRSIQYGARSTGRSWRARQVLALSHSVSATRREHWNSAALKLKALRLERRTMPPLAGTAISVDRRPKRAPAVQEPQMVRQVNLCKRIQALHSRRQVNRHVAMYLIGALNRAVDVTKGSAVLRSSRGGRTAHVTERVWAHPVRELCDSGDAEQPSTGELTPTAGKDASLVCPALLELLINSAPAQYCFLLGIPFTPTGLVGTTPIIEDDPWPSGYSDGPTVRLAATEARVAQTLFGEGSRTWRRWYEGSPSFRRVLADLVAEETHRRAAIVKSYVGNVQDLSVLAALALQPKHVARWNDWCILAEGLHESESNGRDSIGSQETTARQCMCEAHRSENLLLQRRHVANAQMLRHLRDEEALSRRKVENAFHDSWGELMRDEWMWANLARTRRRYFQRRRQSSARKPNPLSTQHRPPALSISRRSRSVLSYQFLDISNFASLDTAASVVQRFVRKVNRISAARHRAEILSESEPLHWREEGPVVKIKCKEACLLQQLQMLVDAPDTVVGVGKLEILRTDAVVARGSYRCADPKPHDWGHPLASAAGSSVELAFDRQFQELWQLLSDRERHSQRVVLERYKCANLPQLFEMRAVFAVSLRGRQRIEEEQRRDFEKLLASHEASLIFMDVLQCTEQRHRLQLAAAEGAARRFLRAKEDVCTWVATHGVVPLRLAALGSGPTTGMGLKAPEAPGLLRFAFHGGTKKRQMMVPISSGCEANSGNRNLAERIAGRIRYLCELEGTQRTLLMRESVAQLAFLVAETFTEQHSAFARAEGANMRLELRQLVASFSRERVCVGHTKDTGALDLGAAYLLSLEEAQRRDELETLAVRSFSSPLERGCFRLAKMTLMPLFLQGFRRFADDIAHSDKKVANLLLQRVARVSTKLDELTQLETSGRSWLEGLESAIRGHMESHHLRLMLSSVPRHGC